MDPAPTKTNTGSNLARRLAVELYDGAFEGLALCGIDSASANHIAGVVLCCQTKRLLKVIGGCPEGAMNNAGGQ